MLIDSHCHLPADEKITEQILKNASQNGVVGVITIGTSIKESENAIKISKKFENVFATVGVYPHEERGQQADTLKNQLENLITSSPKVIGLGECGIDIAPEQKESPQFLQRALDDQLKLFEMQIELALKHNLPLIIHNRGGDEHIIKTLQKYSRTAEEQNKTFTGVAHCFDGSWELAQKYLDLNFYISFSGFITFNSKKYLQETVEKAPLDRFLVETDSPYIVPKGIKEQKNEPKNVRIVALKVAEMKNLPFEEVCQSAYDNTCRLFNLNLIPARS